MGRVTVLLSGPCALFLLLQPVQAGPRAPDTLIYTHLTHEKRYKVGDCESCHNNILTSKYARNEHFSDDMSCDKADCHNIKDQKTCNVCHTNPDGVSPPKPKREIKHSHKAHYKEKIECMECHKDVYDRTHFTRDAVPKMLTCLPCHQEKRVSNRCEYCHTDPDLALSHGIRWRREHGDHYGQDPKSCMECHTQNHCDNCHQGLEPMSVHEGNYLYTHSFDSFEDQTQCYNCHSGARYCNDCHNKSWGRVTNHAKHIKKTGSCKECH